MDRGDGRLNNPYIQPLFQNSNNDEWGTIHMIVGMGGRRGDLCPRKVGLTHCSLFAQLLSNRTSFWTSFVLFGRLKRRCLPGMRRNGPTGGRREAEVRRSSQWTARSWCGATSTTSGFPEVPLSANHNGSNKLIV
jgi:hypothetical protein